MLKVLECGPLNTVQDSGRTGVRHLGVGVAGPMDPVSFRLGNILAGNADSAAVIEIQTYPFDVAIIRDGRVAVTGCGIPRLDGVELPAFWSGPVRAGQTLSIEFGQRGARTYLCLTGGVDVPVVLGSRSTQLRGGFGGYSGRELAENDIIDTGSAPLMQSIRTLPDYGIAAPWANIPKLESEHSADIIVRALPGGESECFTTEARELFWSSSWRITQQSNRTGYRLAGHALTLERPIEMRSHGVIPGVIQVPPSGQPIVQMADGNTVGGYPKIAHVIDADIWQLGQSSPGQSVRFVNVSHQEALAASSALADYFKQTRQQLLALTSAATAWRS